MSPSPWLKTQPQSPGACLAGACVGRSLLFLLATSWHTLVLLCTGSLRILQCKHSYQVLGIPHTQLHMSHYSFCSFPLAPCPSLCRLCRHHHCNLQSLSQVNKVSQYLKETVKVLVYKISAKVKANIFFNLSCIVIRTM